LDKVSIREVTHIKSRHISTSDLSSFLSPHSALQPLSQLYCRRPFIFVVSALAGCYLVLFFLCKSPDLATVPSHLLLQTSVITCFCLFTPLRRVVEAINDPPSRRCWAASKPHHHSPRRPASSWRTASWSTHCPGPPPGRSSALFSCRRRPTARITRGG
jgi:hypothetical protein